MVMAYVLEWVNGILNSCLMFSYGHQSVVALKSRKSIDTK